jgi:hypothetical protein
MIEITLVEGNLGEKSLTHYPLLVTGVTIFEAIEKRNETSNSKTLGTVLVGNCLSYQLIKKKFFSFLCLGKR